jgi:hypothetical protein
VLAEKTVVRHVIFLLLAIIEENFPAWPSMDWIGPSSPPAPSPNWSNASGSTRTAPASWIVSIVDSVLRDVRFLPADGRFLQRGSKPV